MTGESALTGAGYRVRAAIFKGRHGGDVFYPSGRDPGGKRRDRPSVPPPPYRPPQEEVWTVPSLAQAQQMARDLRIEHGDKVVIHIEPVEAAPARPRPQQTSLAELGGWPRGWPRQRWTQ